LARPVDLEDLDADLVALLEDVAHALDALARDLRDVEEPVGAGHDLHEGAEVDDLPHLALVDLPDLGLGRDPQDPVDRLLHRGAVARGDLNGAVVLDVDRAAGLLDERADDLAAGADDVADLVRADLDRGDAGRVGRHLLTWARERLRHLAQDVEAAGARLLERRVHDLARDAADLDVHLERGHAFRRAGDLEVHVAEMVLVAQDVGEDGDVLAVLDEAHRDARDRRLHLDAGVEQRERRAADRRHRRRAVRLEDLRHDPDRVRELLLAREDGRDRALREGAVADLAPAGPAQELHLTDAVRREVVVQHETLERLAEERVDALLIPRRAERRRDQRLGLSAREHGRAVNARQEADVAADRSHVGEAAAVEALLVAHDHLPDGLVLEVRELARDVLLEAGELGGEGLDRLRLGLVELGRALVLRG